MRAVWRTVENGRSGEDDSGGTGGERRKRDATGTGEETRRERERGLYNPRAYSISTEINQGCAQISKREITKINRPDVRRDKKRDSLASLLSFFFSNLPCTAEQTGISAAIRRVIRGEFAAARAHGFISITPIVPIKFPGDKPGTLLIATRLYLQMNSQRVDRNRHNSLRLNDCAPDSLCTFGSGAIPDIPRKREGTRRD